MYLFRVLEFLHYPEVIQVALRHKTPHSIPTEIHSPANLAAIRVYEIGRLLESTDWHIKNARFEALGSFGLAVKLEDCERAMAEIWGAAEEVSGLSPAETKAVCSQFGLERNRAEDYV